MFFAISGPFIAEICFIFGLRDAKCVIDFPAKKRAVNDGSVVCDIQLSDYYYSIEIEYYRCRLKWEFALFRCRHGINMRSRASSCYHFKLVIIDFLHCNLPSFFFPLIAPRRVASLLLRSRIAGAVVFDDVIVSALRSQNGHTPKMNP